MFRRLVMMTAIWLVGCLIPAPTACGWVYRNQPHDGMETYETSQAAQASAAQRASLLGYCDKKGEEWSAGGEWSRPEGDAAKRLVSDLESCGLIYGVDHQREKSVECFQRSLDVSARLGDLKQKGKTLYHLGIVHNTWGQAVPALDYFKQTVDVSAGSGDLVTKAQALNLVGMIHMLWAQYGKALEAYREAEIILAKQPDPSAEVLLLDNIGLLYEAWGQNDKAIELYEKSMAVKKRSGMTGSEVASCVMLGRTYYSSGDLLKAMGLFERGLEIAKRHGYPSNTIYDIIGNVFLDQGQMGSAEEYLKKGGYWSSLGRLYLSKQEFTKAGEYYEKLLRWATPRQIPDYLFTAETGLGLVCEGRTEYPQAEQHLRKAVDLAEEQRARIGPEERLEFLQTRMGGFPRTTPYEALARVLIKMGKPVAAFEVSEYSKARTFADTFVVKQSGSRSDVPPDVLEKDSSLNAELAVLQRERTEAYQDANQERATRLESKVRDLKAKLKEHIRELRGKYPLFAATRYPQPMELDQMGLHQHQWVLSYDVTDTGIVVYLLKGKKLVHTSFKPVARKDLDELVRAFRIPLEIRSDDDIAQKLSKFDFESGRKLSDLLLGGVLGQLPKEAPVIIVPDDSLGVLPFEMLPLGSTGEVRTDKQVPYVAEAEFFCDRNLISYYHSVTALTLARSLGVPGKAHERALVLADPVFQMSDRRAQGLKKTQVARADQEVMTQLMAAIQGSEGKGTLFSRLPYTERLARSLREIYKGNADVLTGLDATKDNFLKKTEPQPSNYGTVVFATHGYVGTDIPGIMEPVLVLSLVPAGADGFVRMSEVTGLKLDAEIVALTACQTGLGRTVSGEGVMGMGRAFQYSGAQSVLMTLWSVAEAPAVTLVENFFKNLRAGKTRSEALHLARKQLRAQEYNHPFFWAPFILVGETR